MVRLYIPPLPQPTASTLVVVDLVDFCFAHYAGNAGCLPANQLLPVILAVD